MDNDRELIHALKLFEMRRRENLTVSCSRNEAYWTELKALLEQGLNDMEEVVECLREKRDNLRLHATLGLKKKGNSHHDKKETSPILVGRIGSMILSEYEIGISSKFQEEATHLETLIKGFTTQSDALEKELKTLWIKGDRLLFTLKLSDQRARKNYEQYTNRFQSNHHGNNAATTVTTDKHSQDLWLLECMYSVSAARSYEIKEECNKQLRFLFGRSKDVETRRQALIFKTFQTFFSRQNELFGYFPTLSTIAMDRLTRVQADAGAGDNIATLLASRVEQEHDTVALNMMQKAQERAREREKQRLANETLSSSSDDGTAVKGAPKVPGASASMAAFFLATESFDTPPPLPFPLHSPFIQESALFYKRSASVIMASWIPVLVCLTRARILHIFELDTDVEREPGTVAAFSNAALRSRKGLELEVLNCGNLVVTSDTTASGTSGTNTTNNGKSNGGKDNVSAGALKDIHTAKYDHLTVRHVLETESFMVPMASLDCSRCSIHYTPKAEDNNPTFEIIEKIPLTGVSSIFRKEKERKIVLRAQDQQQLIDWILKFETK